MTEYKSNTHKKIGMKYAIKTLEENRPPFRKKGDTYVQLPKEVIEFLSDGSVVNDGTKRRYFMPFVFEKEPDDIYGDVFRMVNFWDIPADDLGLNHIEVKKLSDEEFAKKYDLDEYGTYKSAEKCTNQTPE